MTMYRIANCRNKLNKCMLVNGKSALLMGGRSFWWCYFINDPALDKYQRALDNPTCTRDEPACARNKCLPPLDNYQMKANASIESIDFDTLNNQASRYALFGVSQQHLLDKQRKARTQLVSDLKMRTEENLFATSSLNGEEVDRYSGYPHSIFNYIAAFVWHDNHHKQQVDGFLEEKGVGLKVGNNGRADS